MRRAAKVDATQAKIVSDLRQIGALVWLVNKELDAVVLFRGRLYALDFKSKGEPLTDTQREMVNAGWPIAFPTTSAEAFRAIGARVDGQ